MNGVDLRGFDYALEPARQRALHRIDVAMAQLAQQEQTLGRAQEHVAACQYRCEDLAQRFTPAHKESIDPRRATLVSQQARHMHQALVEAQHAVICHLATVDQARVALERARTEQEAFEAHRAESMADHVLQLGRRQQAAADQDWIARHHLSVNPPRSTGHRHETR